MPNYTMKSARSTVSLMLLQAQQEMISMPLTPRPFKDLTALEVHKEWIGGLHPNRMPMACNAMRQLMGHNDVILEQPPSGLGPRLRIRYYLVVEPWKAVVVEYIHSEISNSEIRHGYDFDTKDEMFRIDDVDGKQYRLRLTMELVDDIPAPEIRSMLVRYRIADELRRRKTFRLGTTGPA